MAAVADSPLHKSPDGLLGAFDLKVRGQNPDLFSDRLQPVVDVYDQYLAQQLVPVIGSTGTITGPATGASTTLTVPDGFAWRVIAVGAISALAAGDAALTAQYSFSLVARSSLPNAVPFAVSPVIAPLAAGNLSRSWGLLLPFPLYLPSGCQILTGMGLSAAPGTPTNFTSRIVAQVFQT